MFFSSVLKISVDFSDSVLEDLFNLSDNGEFVIDLFNSLGISSGEFFTSLDFGVKGGLSFSKFSFSVSNSGFSNIEVSEEFLLIGFLSLKLFSELIEFGFGFSKIGSEVSSSSNLVSGQFFD
jgi:hypothetical protein